VSVTRIALAGACLLGMAGMEVAVASLPAAAKVPKPATYVAIATDASGAGYWSVQTGGTVFAYGDAPALTNTNCDPTFAAPVVAAVATPDGLGLWEVTAKGAIACFGDADYFGSAGALTLNRPIVSMNPSPDGRGYRMVVSDGGIFCYGDASFRGSPGGTVLPKPIVGSAGTPDGLGYWLVGASGIVYPEGDAPAYGNAPKGSHIVAIVGTPDGNGYWLLNKSGAVANFGDAASVGSTTVPAAQRMVSLADTPSGNGYYELGLHGVVSPQGSASPALHTGSPTGPVVAVGDVLTGAFTGTFTTGLTSGACSGTFSETVVGNPVAHGPVTLTLQSGATCSGSGLTMTLTSSPSVAIDPNGTVVRAGSSIDVTVAPFTSQVSSYGTATSTGLLGSWISGQSSELVSGTLSLGGIPVSISWNLGALVDSSVAGSPTVFVN
jgi:hypothetical protein